MKAPRLFLAATIAALSTFASADVINFDDLNTNSFSVISNGYQGFNWDNFYVVNGLQYSGNTGYRTGTVSAPNVAFNGSSGPASFSSANAFSLNSIQVTKAWNSGVTHFDGYVGNTLTYQMDVMSTTASPTFASFNWFGLNKVTMSDGDGSAQSAIDNISVTAVPEPETYVMLLAGLGLIGTIARRKQSNAVG